MRGFERFHEFSVGIREYAVLSRFMGFPRLFAVSRSIQVVSEELKVFQGDFERFQVASRGSLLLLLLSIFCGGLYYLSSGMFQWSFKEVSKDF